MRQSRMATWIIKADPEDYGWAELVRDGRTRWTGVRNAQALRSLRAMHAGDEVLLYETGGVRAIVGVCRVVSNEASEGGEEAEEQGPAVVVEAVRAAQRALTLAWIKEQASLAGLGLVKQPRLSVMPVSASEAGVLRAAMRGKDVRS